MLDLLGTPKLAINDRGYQGQIATTGPVNVVTRINRGTLPIDFGVAVARIAVGDGISCKAPTADTDVIVGLSVRQMTKVYNPATGTVSFAVGDDLGVLREGYMWVTAIEAAAEGAGVISLTAQNGALGSTTAAAAGAGRVLVPGAKWDEPVAAGKLGRVVINNLGL
jgi:hypothetical protein